LVLIVKCIGEVVEGEGELDDLVVFHVSLRK
jgi:hypothetical protein